MAVLWSNPGSLVKQQLYLGKEEILLRKYILTAISLIILITNISSTALAKSLYAVADHDTSTLKAYDIQGNQLEYQANSNITNYGTGAVDITIDSNLKLLFVTYANSPVIVWVNAETLAQEGSITVPGASNLAGIVADERRQKVYAVERASNILHICAWDRDKKSLVLAAPWHVALTDLGDNGAWGLALDDKTGLLYVANNTTMVHYYRSDDWTHLGTRDVGRPAADVAIDPNNGQHNAYLYTGALYTAVGQGHNFLVKHDLEASFGSIFNVESDIGTVAIGLAVDPDSGLVYTTTSNQQVEVYDCSESPFICTYSESTNGISCGAGICISKGNVSYKLPLALSKAADVTPSDYVWPGDYVVYTINFGNPVTDTSDPHYAGDVNDVVVIDHLPFGTDFSSASNNGLYDSNLHTVNWYIGMLEPGSTASATVTIKINKNAKPGVTLTNYCEIGSEATYSKAKTETRVSYWCNWDPSPANGATDVTQTPILNWKPGEKALWHDVYFSTDQTGVGNADTTTLGIYQGRQAATSYSLRGLEWGQSYYWRVDQVNDLHPNSPWIGNLWSFTTADYLIVDDFEDYNDYTPDRIFETWRDGFGYGSPPPAPGPYYPGNGSGSTIGYAEAPFAEQAIVHYGIQSMPFDYNNISFPYYSEVKRTSDTTQDWTRESVGVLSLWLYGKPSNSVERLYLILEDSALRNAVVFHKDPNVILTRSWQEWTIDLQAFADQGVNLANVNTIAIGFGNKKNPVAGGSGKIYIDDIRLYWPQEPAP